MEPCCSGTRRAGGGNPGRLSQLEASKADAAGWGPLTLVPTPGLTRRLGLAYFTLMSVLPIITIPDPVLRKISDPVERVDSAVVKLMDDMLETMYDAPGIGLAAIQVGVPQRIVVIDAADEGEERKPLCLVNPEIVKLGSATRLYEEGCLSIPDVRVEIERPDTVTVRYIDRAGKAAGDRGRWSARNRSAA